MAPIDVDSILRELQNRQPIFHSEADFQHALAWEIHTRYPNATVRLEIHPGRIGPREYIDIWVKHGDAICVIELKYKTRKLDAIWNGEEFHLLNQGAQDIGRYDFIKDVVRVERFVTGHPMASGYAVLLTNDDTYWRTTTRLDTADSSFRIHDDRELSGALRWSEATGPGTMRGRENPLILTNLHRIHWIDYSELPEKGPNKFRYALLRIESPQ
ncbi:MAG TPA: hypothetical protein VFW94_14505 [Candidatus Acidoferrales bacterium]|nr:hypothetical protein [Candidatus Acidoferrales bacterium]